MIKVNLKSRKAAVGVSTSTGEESGLSKAGGSFAGIFARFGGFKTPFGNSEEIKSLVILGVVLASLAGAAWWYVDDQEMRALAEVATEMNEVDSKISLLDSELNKTKGYEQIKKSLEADEKTIRTKITTIQQLILERATPPKILMTLSEAIPNNVWLKDFSLKDGRFQVTGFSDGMDVVSDFMKRLEETAYFKGVILKSSKQENINGRLSAQFEIEADRR